MKVLMLAISGLCLVTSLLAVRAEDTKDTNPAKASASTQARTERKRPALTKEQKQARKDLLAKYDTNKDGKLNKEERQKISAEELKKAGFDSRARAAHKNTSKNTKKS